MENRYNVVVVGKTGVGKSSFINYLYGQDIMKTGTGKPVTKKGAFDCIEIKINDLPVRIFDSWGLETGKSKEWKSLLEKEFDKRDVTADINQWFHTIFYCISAGGSKVEDFEVDTINNFIQEDYKVHVIFTKADQASKEDIEKLGEVLDKELDVKVDKIPVCSEEKELFNGTKTIKFGKEKVIEMINKGFWDSIKLRIPKRIDKKIYQDIDKWCSEQKEYIEESVNILNAKKMEEFMERKINEFINETVSNLIVSEIKNILMRYSMILKNIDANINIEEREYCISTFSRLSRIDVELITIFPGIFTGLYAFIEKHKNIFEFFEPLSLKIWKRAKIKKKLLKEMDNFNMELKKIIRNEVTPKIPDLLDEIKKEASGR